MYEKSRTKRKNNALFKFRTITKAFAVNTILNYRIHNRKLLCYFISITLQFNNETVQVFLTTKLPIYIYVYLKFIL